MLNFLRGNVLTIFAGILLFGPFLFGYYLLGVIVQAPFILFTSIRPDPYFHLIVPATDKNEYLCKLMLSSRILGYPDPVFVGWGDEGEYKGTESHLFKISETLAYLQSLPPSSDEDIVLLLDGYDVWLQLRPDVLIKRYNSVIEDANQRLQNEGIHGKLFAGADVRASIVFGADKRCWPQDANDAVCQVVPESSMPRNAFGPNTDNGLEQLDRPRWLNSGTIMGPVLAMRELFAAAMETIKTMDSGTSSDQFYFNQILGEQEISRHKLRNASWEEAFYSDYPDLARIPESKRTEYHVTLDYESEMFQILAWYEEHLAWLRLNATTVDRLGHASDGRMPRLDELRMNHMIYESDPPFTGSNGKDGLAVMTQWEGVALGTNAVTGLPFPALHMTSSKYMRDALWSRMWYFGTKEYVEALFTASTSRLSAKKGHVFANIEDIRYKPAVARLPEFSEKGEEEQKGLQGGAWTASNEFLPFNDVCEDYEDTLYGVRNDADTWYNAIPDFTVPSPEETEENQGGSDEGGDEGNDAGVDENADAFPGEGFEDFEGGDDVGFFNEEGAERHRVRTRR